MKPPVLVRGLGAVSPAGWGVSELVSALNKGESLPATELARPGRAASIRVRSVPTPSHRPAFLGHARLRRTSRIAHFAVAAALEALGAEQSRVSDGSIRLGVILCVMAGGVNYSRRFYDEALRDPALASPLLFPETVFNAPASHLAAFLGIPFDNYTLVGDPGTFLLGISLAADWLEEERVDGCLVVGAEESDWLVAEAFWRFEKRSILSEGAGALYLSRTPQPAPLATLTAVTDAHSFTQGQERAEAARQMRAQLPAASPGRLLCDGLQGLTRFDRPERDSWSDWNGPRLSPKGILGEGLAAGSAWQCVAAINALQSGLCSEAVVSVVGCNQQAIGALFNGARGPQACGGENGADADSILGRNVAWSVPETHATT